MAQGRGLLPHGLGVALLLVGGGAAPAFAQEAPRPASPEQQALEDIRSELSALRQENADLKRRLDQIEQPRVQVILPPPEDPAASHKPDLTPDLKKPADGSPILFPTEASDRYALPQPVESYAAWAPGRGFKLADTPHGELNVSAYMLARYLDQEPGDDTEFLDHLGRTRTIDPRADIQWQRVMVWLNGWALDPKFRYQTIFWTVNSTNQVAIAGALIYHFNNTIEVGTGINRLPGTYSMMGSHPYWLAPDRMMADEFFRPGMTGGIWATGEIAPRLHYFTMLGNNLSELGINAAKLTRDKAWGAALWWMPTTGEFGPRGGMGDSEFHQQLATRFGIHYTRSREDRFSQANQSSPDNTQIRLSDSTLLFETGALAPGVTIDEADWSLTSANAGFKYQGWALHAEVYFRHLGEFVADGPLPLREIEDQGFYAISSYDVLPEQVQLYAGTSQLYGEFNNSSEYQLGLNWYPYPTRNLRVNAMVMNVNKSPVNSLFGYYVGGQVGMTYTASVDFLY